MNSYSVSLRNLKIKFAQDSIISYKDLDFEESKIYILQGENGSGKTSLLKAIQNIYPLFSGQITMNGEKNNSKNVQKNISSFFDKDKIFDFLTPIEYLSLIAANYEKSSNKIKETIKIFENEFSKTWSEDKKLIRDYSDGNKQLIGICAALMAEPALLLLDEPFNFLDEVTRKKLGNFLNDWQAKAKSTVILSSNLDLSTYLKEFEIVKI